MVIKTKLIIFSPPAASEGRRFYISAERFNSSIFQAHRTTLKQSKHKSNYPRQEVFPLCYVAQNSEIWVSAKKKKNEKKTKHWASITLLAKEKKKKKKEMEKCTEKYQE